MKKLFENRQLSRNQARGIAHSQYDLGEKSQLDMRNALAGIIPSKALADVNLKKEYKRVIDLRIEAFERLDPLSKFIVLEFLGNGSIEEAEASIGYAIDNLNRAKDAIANLEIA